jgi:hypothetical protein
MKGSPRSVWLSWANKTAGWWTSAMATAMTRQAQGALKAATSSSPAVKPRRRKKRRRAAS